MITKKELIKEIRKQNKKGYFNFLGFVENKDLSQEVESYFTGHNCFGEFAGYDWVNGNKKLKELIDEVTLQND